MTEPTQPTDPFAGAPLAGQPPAGAPFAGAPAGAPFGPAPVTQTPLVPVTMRRRSTSALLVNLLLGVALVVAVGGVAFAAGRATAPAATAPTNRNGLGGNGQFFGPNASGAPGRDGFAGGGGISLSGTVTAVSADSITLQLASGQSITIPTTDQTTYHSQTAATAADVTSGSSVIVQLNGGGRFVNGGGQGGGNGGGQNPAASGAPVRGVGSASSITVVPKGS
jgi:hypothetical protein